MKNLGDVFQLSQGDRPRHGLCLAAPFMLSDPAGELRRRWNTTFLRLCREGERSTPTIDSDLEVSKAKRYPMLLGRFWAWFWVRHWSMC